MAVLTVGVVHDVPKSGKDAVKFVKVGVASEVASGASRTDVAAAWAGGDDVAATACRSTTSSSLKVDGPSSTILLLFFNNPLIGT